MCILLLLDEMFFMYLIKSIWPNVSFKAAVYLLIFCLDDLSVDVSGILKSPTTIMSLFISTFRSINMCSLYLGPT